MQADRNQFPSVDHAWDYENGFYLTCSSTRMAKMLAQYELFKTALEVPGDIVECGVFKGASLARLAMFRDLFAHGNARQIIGFDSFGPFPKTEFEADKPYLQRFLDSAGEESITVQQMREVLDQKSVGEDVVLVPGDICQTVPDYTAEHPHLRISFLNLDTDVYEPAKVILEHLYPRIVPGGILLLDDYGVFPGETQAVDEYFADQPDVVIQSYPFARTPSFIVK